MLPLGRLLQLVPKFTEGLKSALSPQNPTLAPTFFTNPGEGPTAVDKNSLVVAVIIKGNKVPETVIDGGSGVNMTKRRTCDTLGIREWESCLFRLRMADTSSVWSTGLIRNLEITIKGRMFRIFSRIIATQCVGSIPSIIRKTVAKDNTH